MLTIDCDFLFFSYDLKHKGLIWLLRGLGTQYSSTCSSSLQVKMGWEQHGSSRSICSLSAREMSVIRIFGKVTQKERKGYNHEREALTLIYKAGNLLSDFILRILGKLL